MVLEAIIGTATGLLSNFLTSWQNNKQQKIKNDHEIKMSEFELKRIDAQTNAMIKEAEANIKITETKIQGEIQAIEAAGEMNAFNESIRLGNEKALSSEWVNKLFESKWTIPFGVFITMLMAGSDFIKHLIRPCLTVFYVLLASYMTYQVVVIMNAANRFVELDEAVTLFNDTKEIVFYLAVTLVTWWFGDRRMAKNMATNKGKYKES